MLFHSYLVVFALSVLTTTAPIESDSLVARAEMNGSGINLWSPPAQDTTPTQKREAEVVVEVEARTPPPTAVWRRKCDADAEVEARTPPYTPVWKRKADFDVHSNPETEVDTHAPSFIAA